MKLLQKELADPMRWICSLLLLALASCGAPREQTKPWELGSDWIERGPVRAKVELRHKEMSILDQQDLCLTVEYPEGMDIEFPAFLERLEDYRLVPWRDDAKESSGGNITLQKFVRYEIFESGDQVLPPFRVLFHDASGNQMMSRHMDTPTLNYHIKSIDNPELIQAPLEDSFELQRPKPYPWLELVGYIYLGTMIIGLLAWWFLSKRRRKEKPPAPPEPAHEWAWRALEMLVNEQESGTLSNEVFVDQLSLILRSYIERRYGIHAPEQTTEEFLSQGVMLHKELENYKAVLSNFMEYSDLIKFAKQSANSEDVQKGFDFIKSFIETTQEVRA